MVEELKLLLPLLLSVVLGFAIGLERKYRLKESLKLTKELRTDLLANRKYSKEELKLLKEIEENNNEPKWYQDALNKAKKFM